MKAPSRFTRADLKVHGFSGFTTVAELRQSNLAAVPKEPGVYVVMRTARSAPTFRRRSPAGRFRGDPSRPIPVLMQQWVPSSTVLYLGKAALGKRGTRNLRKRLAEYLSFGAGGNARHYGGRCIWQLADSDDLLICWKVVHGIEPRLIEKSLLQQFVAIHGRRPFANLTG